MLPSPFPIFGSTRLSPVRSTDLIRAAETFESNPFYPIFSEKLAAIFSGWEPSVVGLSINFMSQALVCLCHDRVHPETSSPGKNRLRRRVW